MATFLLYLGPYLGPCSILVTASSGGVYIYSCCSYCGYCYGCYCGDYYGGYSCCGDSYGGYCWWVGILFTDLAYYAGCLGAVGVRGDVLALEWDGAYTDGACADGVYTDGACIDGAYTDGAYYRI